METNSYVKSFFVDLPKELVEMLSCAGPYLYCDTLLLQKVCRVLKGYYLSALERVRCSDGSFDPESGSGVNGTPRLHLKEARLRIEEALGTVLLPSLQLTPANLAVGQEIWDVMNLLPYEARYCLYGEWEKDDERIPMVLAARQTAKIEAYRDMIAPVVDAFKYLTQHIAKFFITGIIYIGWLPTQIDRIVTTIRAAKRQILVDTHPSEIPIPVAAKREKTLLSRVESHRCFIDKRTGEQNDELGEFDKAILRSQHKRQREKTLLSRVESHRCFIDKRTGEQNDELGEFDKAILRSQHKRQLKLNKKSKYNLSDGEEDEIDYQNGLQGRDDFEDEVPFDEEDVAAPDTETRESTSVKNHLAALPTRAGCGNKSLWIALENSLHRPRQEMMPQLLPCEEGKAMALYGRIPAVTMLRVTRRGPKASLSSRFLSVPPVASARLKRALRQDPGNDFCETRKCCEHLILLLSLELLVSLTYENRIVKQVITRLNIRIAAETVKSLFGSFVELVKSFNLPSWLVHWGHPGNMVKCSLFGFLPFFSPQKEEKAKAKDLHPKLLAGMFFFFALGATGGVTSLLTSDKPILESKTNSKFGNNGIRGWNGPLFPEITKYCLYVLMLTGSISLALLTIQTILPTLFEVKMMLQFFHSRKTNTRRKFFIFYLGLSLGLNYPIRCREHGILEAFHQLVARVDLNESEDQMVARYISGLSITIQDALAMQTLWTVSEAYNRALVAEKQEKRKFSRSGQQYQGGTKSGQPFYSYARGGSSSSGGQGASSGVGTQNRADKASTPAQNQPQSGASGLKSIPKWGL
ncbi:hypothetical protein RHGRI_011495 [Rhododendron griersonianum]|uniref:THO complex subunit 2 N-terminal domain-containing protein n=1 Tax=Rhododendron griersonianum TaxID=479676 RepID=A0AAV6KMC3_9ERIC|nr:hypothetical protein RHGRI_011495 [Rhododendron griersonianum]